MFSKNILNYPGWHFPYEMGGLEHTIKLDDGWPESEKGTDVDVKYIEERRRCEKISEERMNI